MDNVPRKVCICIYTSVFVCVCIASKANHAWGHPKRLRRRIHLCTHTPTHILITICMDSITHTYACVYADNSAAGELSKSDQRLHVQVQVPALSIPVRSRKYIHTCSCA